MVTSMSEFEPPRVDGIAPPIPMVTIHEVLRLDGLGFSSAVIAATLHVTVMDVEQALRKAKFRRALAGWNYR